ncbi:MAG: DUF3108 domain-containing protein [Candidatus Omnitrophota bacterium]|nr:DUF3108 domain-containing protein [Candidatus Omnitrophota bacterium]
MKINKIFIGLAIVLTVFVSNDLLKAETVNYDFTGESIQYGVQPVGKSEYKNLGSVDLKGAKAGLVTIKSKILFVEVAERVFYDPETSLPYKTERINSGLWIKEYRTEEYDQNKFTVVIKKFKRGKLIKVMEKTIKTDGPIQNMNTLLLYLRKQPDLKIGWHLATKVPNELELTEFDLKLISIDEIIVPGGKFQAYHFKSVPDTFEIWIDKSGPRIPLKIRIKGIVSCTILMKGYSLHNN